MLRKSHFIYYGRGAWRNQLFTKITPALIIVKRIGSKEGVGVVRKHYSYIVMFVPEGFGKS